MELFNKIINIVFGNSTKEEIFQTLGTLKKRVENIVIFNSDIEGIEGISIVINDNQKISNVSFVLKEAIPFEEIKRLFTNYYLGYNYYDEMSILSFEINKDIKVLAKINGYINNDELCSQYFAEFELIKMG